MKTRFVETEDEREVKEDGYFRGDSGFRSRDRRGDFHRRGDGFRGRRGMGPCAARPVSKKSDVKEGSNAVKAVLEETAAKEVFSIRREVSGKTVVKEDSNAVKAVLEETAAKEVFSIRREVSGKTVVKEGSNAVKAALGDRRGGGFQRREGGVRKPGFGGRSSSSFSRGNRGH